MKGVTFMRLLNPIIVKCNHCKAVLNISVDLECISSCERSMGEEIGYEGIIHDNCPNCGNEIKVNLLVWEYPVGAINYQEEECEGAVIIQGPVYDPFSYDDFW